MSINFQLITGSHRKEKSHRLFSIFAIARAATKTQSIHLKYIN